ncbi:Uncharacterized protein APZ42_025929 [Daphnia magna]|uniref:Integrase catalytic domain-containing protein n=1 Tax=Daphnia magna TaxID=35525 RepID=A0A162DC33_9CRUS|nr:Uncharacterized protein APZ42_025929 [Daphnia magna]
MAVTNLSDLEQWIEEGTVLGIIEPVTEINERDIPIVAATAVTEKKALREHEFENRLGEELMPTDREKIREVLAEYGDCFSWPEDQLGLCTTAEHTINIREVQPVRQSPHARPRKERIFIKIQCKQMEKAGVIEPLNSRWRAAVVLDISATLVQKDRGPADCLCQQAVIPSGTELFHYGDKVLSPVKKDLAGRLTRWALSIQNYQPEIVYKSGRLHEDADELFLYPVDGIGDSSDEEDLLPVYTTSWEQERRWTREMQCRKLERRNEVASTHTPGSADGQFRRVPWRSLGCAFGSKENIGVIEERFYWPRLQQHALSYVRSCSQFQTRKTPPLETQGHMVIIRVERPFEKVGMDVMGTFPVSTGGKKNIVAVDYLTKWAETMAISTAMARDTAEFFFEEILLRHGAPASVVTDCGKCFAGKFTKEVMHLMEVDNRTTTPYHTQANGLVERLNHTLGDILSMYINSPHSNLEDILPYITFAYNSSIQELTGKTPFFLIYDREARLPVDVVMGVRATPLSEDPCALARNLETARKMVKERLVQVQERPIRHYEATWRVTPEFRPVEKVLVYKPFRKVSKAGQLLHRWLGPFAVVHRV